METLNAIVVIGLGVAFGVTILGLIDMLISIPRRIARRRAQKQFIEAMHGMAKEVVKDLERIENAKATKVQKAKTTKRTTNAVGKKASGNGGSRSQAGRKSGNTNSPVRSRHKRTSQKVSNKSR